MYTATNPEKSVKEQTAFFIEQLNIFYCVKSHLAERLPEIAEEKSVISIKPSLDEAVLQMEKDLDKTEEIFDLLNETISFDNCETLITYLDHAFSKAHYQFAGENSGKLSLMAYLHYIEAIEKAALQLMKVAAEAMGNTQITERLDQNLNDNDFESSLLLKLISDNVPLFG